MVFQMSLCSSMTEGDETADQSMKSNRKPEKTIVNASAKDLFTRLDTIAHSPAKEEAVGVRSRRCRSNSGRRKKWWHEETGGRGVSRERGPLLCDGPCSDQ